MSTDQIAMIPTFTMGHRMRLALEDRGYSIADAAARFGVSRNTITNWCNGHHAPKRFYVQGWAEWLNVPETWLRWGVVPTDNGSAQLPHLDSNQKPFGTRSAA
jgi:transcriptional regulator with XRE-family HTH domain